MEKYSISRINTYLENPWKHWCKYISKMKPKYDPEVNKYMDRGTVFHKVMECMGKGQDEANARATALLMANEEGFAQEAKDCGFLAVDRYLEEYGTERFDKVIETEYELNYQLSDTAEFIGFIDAIVQNDDGTVTLVDYKTYGNSPSADKLKYSMQANMYMYIATKLGFNVKDFMFDCVNPKATLRGRAYRTKRVSFRYNERTSEFVYDQFLKIVKLIEADPEYKAYTIGDYMPDMYDMLFKVYVGDVTEDIEEFIDRNFIVKGD